MTTDDGDRTYTKAALRKLREIEAQQLLDRLRAELLAAMRVASSEEERERLRAAYEQVFGPLSQPHGDGG